MKSSRSTRLSSLAALVASGVLGLAVPGWAATYNVTTTAGLESAVSAANASPGLDTINVAPGLYTPSTLTVTDALTVNGGGRPGAVIDAGGASAVFSIFFSSVTFNDLTVQNGFIAGIDYFSGPSSLLRVNRSTITSNGIGVWVEAGPAEIVNSTISGNATGIEYEASDPLTLENDTIVFNYGSDGGFANFGFPSTVRNTIIAENSGGDCVSPPDVADHNIDRDGSCGAGFTHVSPEIFGLTDNGGPTRTYRLGESSPAIDAGSCRQPSDQRGVPRPQGVACDIGAFELTPFRFDTNSGAVGAGGSITTDTEVDGATPTDPVETTVKHPLGGTIAIDEGPGAAEFGFIGQRVQIDASPAATPTSPLVIVFLIDSSIIPLGQSAATIVVTKDSVVVPPCTGPPGTASPDPCVTSRQTVGDDAQITVLSSTASAWDLAPEPTTPSAGAVPDGGDHPGVPLTVTRSGGDLTLSWGASCSTTDTDYEIYEGTLGSYYSHTQKLCSTAGATTMSFPEPAGSSYFLVVPNNAVREGSYGHKSDGTERPQGTSACLPQQIAAVCP